MHLAEPGGDSLRLQVLRYQFPREKRDYHDANWLAIRTEATNSRGTWMSVDPSLLTSEVSSLAGWLEDLSLGRVVDNELGFIEPNLSFEFVERNSDAVRLRAWFELESRPRWAKSSTAEARDLCVDLTVPLGDLADGAESLRSDLRRFPPRLGGTAN